MKKYHLILLSTVLFITLFYGETPGINIGILGVVYAVLTFFKTWNERRTKSFFAVLALSILSSFAFAYYGDFVSLVAVVTSLFLLAFLSEKGDLKSIFVIPVFITNFITFIYRVFQVQEWLPKMNTSAGWQKFVSVVLIPVLFLLIFFGIYSLASDHFSNLFTAFEFDFDFWQFLGIGLAGFFLAFNFWNFKIYRFIFTANHHLKNDFVNEDKIRSSTYPCLPADAERKSGIVSLFVLNVLLFIFLLTFNYEQFVEVAKTPNQLSAETHERVNAVILSIIMAIVVILFYFKGNFNFDEKAGPLKILAKIWIALNIILVLSAAAKNSEYILKLGVTYKRLGVYAFLILCVIGLIVTFLKIQHQKTNAFLFNHMIWYFYGTVLVCSFINWGGIATRYNLDAGKGTYDFLSTFNFNDEILRQKFPDKIDLNFRAREPKYGTFLSENLYNESLKTP